MCVCVYFSSNEKRDDKFREVLLLGTVIAYY